MHRQPLDNDRILPGTIRRTRRNVSASANAVRPVSRVLCLAALGALLSAAGVGLSSAYAQTIANSATSANMRRYDVPRGSLSGALNRLADQADVLISVPGELTAGKTSNGVSGTYSVDEAFQKLLSGTGLEALRQPDGSYSRLSGRAPHSCHAPDYRLSCR
jgi:iron complex outermembrane receptor protein